MANKTGSKRGDSEKWPTKQVQREETGALSVMANKKGSKKGNRSTQSNGQQNRFKERKQEYSQSNGQQNKFKERKQEYSE